MLIQSSYAKFQPVTMTLSTEDCQALWPMVEQASEGPGGWHDRYRHFPECMLNFPRDLYEALRPTDNCRIPTREGTLSTSNVVLTFATLEEVHDAERCFSKLLNSKQSSDAHYFIAKLQRGLRFLLVYNESLMAFEKMVREGRIPDSVVME